MLYHYFQGHQRLVKQIRVALSASFNIRPQGGHESLDSSSRGGASAKLGSMAAGKGTFARDSPAESMARSSMNDNG